MATPAALGVAANVPQALPAHPEPVSVHVTPRFLVSLRTVAVNFCVPILACTLALAGGTLTVIRDCAPLSGAPGKPQNHKTRRTVDANLHTGNRCGWLSTSLSSDKVVSARYPGIGSWETEEKFYIPIPSRLQVPRR